MKDFHTKCLIEYKKMQKAVFFLMMMVSSSIYGESMECQVLKERIFSELKHIETLKATNDNKGENKIDNSQTNKTPFSDAFTPSFKQQQMLNSEALITLRTKEYKQKCE